MFEFDEETLLWGDAEPLPGQRSETLLNLAKMAKYSHKGSAHHALPATSPVAGNLLAVSSIHQHAHSLPSKGLLPNFEQVLRVQSEFMTQLQGIDGNLASDFPVLEPAEIQQAREDLIYELENLDQYVLSIAKYTRTADDFYHRFLSIYIGRREAYAEELSTSGMDKTIIEVLKNEVIQSKTAKGFLAEERLQGYFSNFLALRSEFNTALELNHLREAHEYLEARGELLENVLKYIRLGVDYLVLRRIKDLDFDPVEGVSVESDQNPGTIVTCRSNVRMEPDEKKIAKLFPELIKESQRPVLSDKKLVDALENDLAEDLAEILNNALSRQEEITPLEALKSVLEIKGKDFSLRKHWYVVAAEAENQTDPQTGSQTGQDDYLMLKQVLTLTGCLAADPAIDTQQMLQILDVDSVGFHTQSELRIVEKILGQKEKDRKIAGWKRILDKLDQKLTKKSGARQSGLLREFAAYVNDNQIYHFIPQVVEYCQEESYEVTDFSFQIPNSEKRVNTRGLEKNFELSVEATEQVAATIQARICQEAGLEQYASSTTLHNAIWLAIDRVLQFRERDVSDIYVQFSEIKLEKCGFTAGVKNQLRKSWENNQKYIDRELQRLSNKYEKVELFELFKDCIKPLEDYVRNLDPAVKVQAEKSLGLSLEQDLDFLRSAFSRLSNQDILDSMVENQKDLEILLRKHLEGFEDLNIIKNEINDLQQELLEGMSVEVQKQAHHLPVRSNSTLSFSSTDPETQKRNNFKCSLSFQRRFHEESVSKAMGLFPEKVVAQAVDYEVDQEKLADLLDKYLAASKLRRSVYMFLGMLEEKSDLYVVKRDPTATLTLTK